MSYQKQNPGWRAGASGASAGERLFHVQSATAEPLLQLLDGVQKSGSGWRARCPACEGQSRKLTVTERDGKVLLHCFGGCAAGDVLAAVGLSWGDVMPPRTWPASPEERRRQRQAIREAGAATAIDVLAVEATVIRLASHQLFNWQSLNPEDDERLALACYRVEKASSAITTRDTHRPAFTYPERALVTMRRGAVRQLRHELEVAESELRDAEAALDEANKRKEAA